MLFLVYRTANFKQFPNSGGDFHGPLPIGCRVGSDGQEQDHINLTLQRSGSLQQHIPDSPLLGSMAHAFLSD